MEYSDEQLKYINYLAKRDTKLIACAGSGKTRCIIARMENLIKQGVYKDDEVLMVTFSRPTQNDFITKIEKYGATNINHDMVRTIDSFAKKIIDPNNEVDVSTLSYTLLVYLQTESSKNLTKHPLLSTIKSIFVDEAQDLNLTQYQIISLMKKKLKCVLNLVGDPNQNIYQWRGSTDAYLDQTKAKVFYLTKNYRSFKHIVDFSKHIRPRNNVTVSHHRESNKPIKPIFFGHATDEVFEHTLIDLLNMLTDNGKTDLADIAVLSPIRGYLRTSRRSKSKGLCFVSNILAKHNVPFIQYYDESTDQETDKVKYERVPGHINLLTYTGSKGLEWDHVIMIDAESALINKMYFTDERHKHDQYLLYVACTRAIKNLFIFAPYTAKSNMRNFNPWFGVVPQETYQVTNHRYFKYGSLNYTDRQDSENQITRLIQKMTEVDLYHLSQKFHVVNTQEYTLYPVDYRKVKTNQSIFLGKLTELIFKYQYAVHFDHQPPRLPRVESLIKKSDVVVVSGYNFWKWYNDEPEVSWEIYDNKREKLHFSIPNVIEKLDRSVPLEDYHFTNDNFYAEMVVKNNSKIKEAYRKYMDREPWTNEMLDAIFMIMVTNHAVETSHYFHINNGGEKYKSVIEDYKEMFDHMWEFVEGMNHDFLKYFNVPVTKYDMEGEIDIIDVYDNVHEIKCIQNINLTHKLQVLLYNYMWHEGADANSENIKYHLSFYNFLEGKRYIYTIVASRRDMESVIKTFLKVGNVKGAKNNEVDDSLSNAAEQSDEIVEKE